MIRSSKVSLKFSNQKKISQLHNFIEEYKRVVSCFINMLWDMDKISSLLSKDLTSMIDSWLSARAIQCAGKQASGIVRGTRKKQEKRKWMIDKFNKDGMFKKARKLQKIYNRTTISKPDIKNVCPELDSRFVKIDLDNKTSFDGWLNLSSLGNGITIRIPFKRNLHI